jgi:hypothetical protein
MLQKYRNVNAILLGSFYGFEMHMHMDARPPRKRDWCRITVCQELFLKATHPIFKLRNRLTGEHLRSELRVAFSAIKVDMSPDYSQCVSDIADPVGE